MIDKILKIISENLPIILTTTMAITTLVVSARKDTLSQRYGLKKDIYIKHYDKMLELLAEYDSSFNSLDFMFNLGTMEVMRSDETAKKGFKWFLDYTRSIDVIRNKICLMINPNNPVTEKLMKILNNSTDATNHFIESIFKISIQIDALQNNTDEDNSEDINSDDEDYTLTMKQFADDMEEFANKLTEYRKHLQTVAKDYLNAEKNELLGKKSYLKYKR